MGVGVRKGVGGSSEGEQLAFGVMLLRRAEGATVLKAVSEGCSTSIRVVCRLSSFVTEDRS